MKDEIKEITGAYIDGFEAAIKCLQDAAQGMRLKAQQIIDEEFPEAHKAPPEDEE